MKIIQSYVGKTVLLSIGLVTLMLVGLQIFILFVNQLGDLGRGNFGFLQVALYVLMQMPYQVYLFFPMACLLGCLIGLGMMANHRELVVMRAAGLSITQVTAIVSKVALLLIIGITLVGETAIPWLERHSNDLKSIALSQGQTLRTARGVWLRHYQDFIHVSVVNTDNSLDHVYQYHFSNDNCLEYARTMEKIIHKDGVWQAKNVKQTSFREDKTTVEVYPSLRWDIPVSPKVLKINATEPDEMTMVELWRFIKAQKKSQQSAQSYELAFWQRAIQPMTTLVMMMLAIPFIFGPLRSSTMGSKFLAGAAVGFGFHLANHFFGPVSMVYQWPPILAGIGPTIVFAFIGLYFMRKVR